MLLMNRRTLLVAGFAGTAATLALALTCIPGTANPAAQARIGAPAPGFTLSDRKLAVRKRLFLSATPRH